MKDIACYFEELRQEFQELIHGKNLSAQFWTCGRIADLELGEQFFLISEWQKSTAKRMHEDSLSFKGFEFLAHNLDDSGNTLTILQVASIYTYLAASIGISHPKLVKKSAFIDLINHFNAPGSSAVDVAQQTIQKYSEVVSKICSERSGECVCIASGFEFDEWLFLDYVQNQNETELSLMSIRRGKKRIFTRKPT
jgi:hypothetical protein